MILVRATGRVLKLEECGIPLEQRFAFYDQIHTTGMDIKHMANAVAVLTLGKDMTFRDYAQGAFRMRGIGRGQKIHLFLTPELRELMIRELTAAKMPLVEPPQVPSILIEVTAWLVVNSMGSERLQFNQLCIQNVTNVYRKNGFRNLLKAWSRFKVDETTAASLKQDHCIGPSLDMFNEPVEFRLEAAVPQPRQFTDVLEELLRDKRNQFVTSVDEVATVAKIQSMVLGLVESSSERAFNQDMVREQEEEKEKMKEIVEEKELEITQFKDQQYSREHEEPKPWPFARLQTPDAMLSQFVDPADLAGAPPMYRAKEFRLFARQPIQFPDSMLVSTNYFDKRWSGQRRVKNVIMSLDWVPQRTKLAPRANPEAHAPTETSEVRTLKALSSDGETIPAAMMQALLNACFEEPCNLETVLRSRSFCTLKEGEDALRGSTYRREDEGRYTAVLSLIEAETIRRIIHIRQQAEVIDNSFTDLALRVVCADNYVMDRTFRHRFPPNFETQTTWNALRSSTVKRA
jgi:hypothetical protein